MTHGGAARRRHRCEPRARRYRRRARNQRARRTVAVVRHRSRRIRRIVRAARTGDRRRHEHRERSSRQRRRAAAAGARVRRVSREACPTTATAIVGVDNALSASLASNDLRRANRHVRTPAGADVRRRQPAFDGLGSSFDVIAGGVCLGTRRAARSRRDQRENALAAIAVGARARDSVRANRRGAARVSRRAPPL